MAVLCLGMAGGHAQVVASNGKPPAAVGYPSRPVKLVEPFGAGGGVDVVARALAGQLTRDWGQPVTVENRPGAGSTEAPARVAKSAPDGYTLLVSSSAHAYAAALPRALAYDPVKDFIPVAPLTRQAYVLVANGSAGISTVAELVAAARAGPNKLKFGSAGVGTGSHIAAERFNLAAHIGATHVPAKPDEGIREVIARTVAGETTFLVAPIPLALPEIRAGRLAALGVTADHRSPLLPEVPTLAEAGIAEFDFPIWYGVWAPVGTPPGVVSNLAGDIARALKAPELRDWLVSHGSEPMFMTPAEFGRFVLGESRSAKQILRGSQAD